MSTSTGTNGAVSVPEQTAAKAEPKKYDPQAYRPKVDRDHVRTTVVTSLAQVVFEALHQASDYVSLARHYDREQPIAVRYAHLVDAAECIETALTYLGMVKNEMAHQMRTDDPSGDSPW